MILHTYKHEMIEVPDNQGCLEVKTVNADSLKFSEGCNDYSEVAMKTRKYDIKKAWIKEKDKNPYLVNYSVIQDDGPNLIDLALLFSVAKTNIGLKRLHGTRTQLRYGHPRRSNLNLKFLPMLKLYVMNTVLVINGKMDPPVRLCFTIGGRKDLKRGEKNGAKCGV